MNMAEGARLRAAEAQILAHENRIKDLERRLDELSNAERARTERETLRLKKSG